MDIVVHVERLTLLDLAVFVAVGSRNTWDSALLGPLIASLDRLVEGGVSWRHPRELQTICNRVAEAIQAHLAAPGVRPYTAPLPHPNRRN